jgi:hypothetical protein
MVHRLFGRSVQVISFGPLGFARYQPSQNSRCPPVQEVDATGYDTAIVASTVRRVAAAASTRPRAVIELEEGILVFAKKSVGCKGARGQRCRRLRCRTGYRKRLEQKQAMKTKTRPSCLEPPVLLWQGMGVPRLSNCWNARTYGYIRYDSVHVVH